MRSTCDKAAVRNGPNSITVNANGVTSFPAVEIEMRRSRASAGSKPTIRNSVVTMTNAEIAGSAMDRGVRGGAARSGMGYGLVRREASQRIHCPESYLG
ncbi:hypothetical protein WM03_31735 [Burkholderia ubonensis]|nr:hypothetical protein WJ65_12085 [Burkholderia ubonensis]KWC29591.1 hypothetical protein WL48_25160 [Burkholderia ubonensis]KWC34274.1 hypothetical protein WL49_23485 [Burkholderia ubonensis]KWI06172.1 hypothetical protein WM02_26380 [Burkholderia ubonensis]KWI38136.1 hypothetical protein WM03_31735 [Burkholderia ubonensis]